MLALLVQAVFRRIERPVITEPLIECRVRECLVGRAFAEFRVSSSQPDGLTGIGLRPGDPAQSTRRRSRAVAATSPARGREVAPLPAHNQNPNRPIVRSVIRPRIGPKPPHGVRGAALREWPRAAVCRCYTLRSAP